MLKSMFQVEEQCFLAKICKMRALFNQCVVYPHPVTKLAPFCCTI